MDEIRVNLVALREIADKGVRRAAVFMGLGVNAARDPRLTDYALATTTGYELVPAGASVEVLGSYKAEFEQWVVGCGLREMTETFGLFLDETYHVCQLFGEQGKLVTRDLKSQIESRRKKFKKMGLKDKLRTLQTNYGVGLKQEKYLLSINKARNCLTHRRGVVGVEDCGQGQSLVVYWRGFDVWAETPEGQKIALGPPLEEQTVVKAGSSIKARQSERSKECRHGQVLRFTPKELAEVGITMSQMAVEVIQAIESYAKLTGIVKATAQSSP